jgi:hypothetical protein
MRLVLLKLGALDGVSTENHAADFPGTSRSFIFNKVLLSIFLLSLASAQWARAAVDWQQVDGDLILIQTSVGDTHVWGVDLYDQIYRRPVDGSGAGQKIPGNLINISAASEHGWIWGVNRTYAIFKAARESEVTQTPVKPVQQVMADVITRSETSVADVAAPTECPPGQVLIDGRCTIMGDAIITPPQVPAPQPDQHKYLGGAPIVTSTSGWTTQPLPGGGFELILSVAGGKQVAVDTDAFGNR